MVILKGYDPVRYSHATDKLMATIQIAQRVYSLAQELNDSALLIGAYNAQIWRSESVQSHQRAAELLPISTDAVDGVQEIGASAVSVLCYEAQAKWHFGEIGSSQTIVGKRSH